MLLPDGGRFSSKPQKPVTSAPASSLHTFVKPPVHRVHSHALLPGHRRELGAPAATNKPNLTSSHTGSADTIERRIAAQSSPKPATKPNRRNEVVSSASNRPKPSSLSARSADSFERHVVARSSIRLTGNADALDRRLVARSSVRYTSSAGTHDFRVVARSSIRYTGSTDSLERPVAARSSVRLTSSADSFERRVVARSSVRLTVSADSLERRLTARSSVRYTGSADALERRPVVRSSARYTGSADTLERRAATRNSAKPTNSSKPKSDHYRIELRAWIPQSETVDPMSTYNKVRDGAVGTPDIPTLPIRGDIDFKYSSHYRGDNHRGYEGSWRARSWVEFDYDGKKISNFKFQDQTSNHGVTHRDWHWDAYAKLKVGPFTPIEKKIASKSGTEEARAVGSVFGKQISSNSFSLGFSQKNPVQDRKVLGLSPSPAIDSRLDGFITNGGKNMTLRYDTDLFPSHGFQVTKNGHVIATEVANDASGVNVTGASGAANIAFRLGLQANEGESQIPIG